MGQHLSQFILSEIVLALHQVMVASCLRVKTNLYFIFGLAFIASLIFSCNPQESLTLTFVEQQSEQNFSINKIQFVDQNNGYALGGDDYLFGIAQHTTDGGQTWSLDTVSAKSVNDFVVKEDTVFGGGLRGYYTTKVNGEPWRESRPDDTDNINGIIKTPSGAIAVGGVAFTFGFITLLDNEMNILSKTSTSGEMTSVFQIDQNNLISAGYGQIYNSEDSGLNWTINEQEGDNYQDIFFINDRIGWIVGQAGSILKTENGGWTWETKRKPEVHNKQDFRAVYFFDEELGFVVGSEGIVWQTSDGGENWSVVEDLPEYNYTSVFMQKDVAWLSTDEGHILQVYL